jgi:hypothetical protein
VRVQELAYPKALLRSGPYECRALDDQFNVAQTSDYMFNNATKQDRYKLMKKPVKPASPNQQLQAAAEKARPDLVFAASQPPEWQKPGGEVVSRSYAKDTATRRADLVANAGVKPPLKEEEVTAKYVVKSGGYLPSIAFPSQMQNM